MKAMKKPEVQRPSIGTRMQGKPRVSEATHWLTEQDYEPVRILIAEARRRRSIAKAVGFWLEAFVLFEKTEDRIGLPGEADRDAYLAIVYDLRASGNTLLDLAVRGEIDIEKEAGISIANFQVCLKMLKIDIGAEALSRDPVAMKRFEDCFASL
jgi:hypothetical protein